MFKVNKKNNSIDLYELFLESVDDLSAIRLRGIDMSFQLLKEKFKDVGCDLSETCCIGPTFLIKRNQDGFYVDESKSLFSDMDYKNYQFGLSVYKKYRKDFERMHQLLSEKEIIMDGYYKCKNLSCEELDNIALSLGYKTERQNAIYEDNPKHPSEEYKNIVSLLDSTRREDVNECEIIESVLDIIKPYFKEEIELETKTVNDKYEMDFDDSFGVLLIDNDIGDMRMLYEVDGFEIKRAEYNKYLQMDCPYLEIYLRIIAKCLKQQYKRESKGKSQKSA